MIPFSAKRLVAVSRHAVILNRRMSSEVNGKSLTSAAGATSEPACALQALQSAFRTSTRVVLATSLQVPQLESTFA